MSDQMRTCYKCHRTLALTSFVRDKEKSNRRTYRCHTCRDATRRSNRAARNQNGGASWAAARIRKAS